MYCFNKNLTFRISFGKYLSAPLSLDFKDSGIVSWQAISCLLPQNIWFPWSVSGSWMYNVGRLREEEVEKTCCDLLMNINVVPSLVCLEDLCRGHPPPPLVIWPEPSFTELWAKLSDLELAGLGLVKTDHVTWILACDWSQAEPGPEPAINR